MYSKNRLMASVLFVAIVTATGSAGAQCVGNCDGGQDVTVNEVITLVNIALGTETESACPNGIPSGAEVNVALIVQAVNDALTGCPVPVSPQLEKAAGVATSSLVALLALLREIPVRAIPVILTEYGETPGSCSEGGTLNLSCQEGGGNSTITASLSECAVLVGDEVTTSNGNFGVVVAKRGVCSSGVIPNNVRLTTHFTSFSAVSSDASSGAEVSRVTLPDFTETVDASGLGCTEELDGTFTLDGSFVVTASDGVDLSGTARNLRLQMTSSGSPCVLQVTGSGSLDLQDNGHDRQFSASFANTRATLEGGPDITVASLDGDVSASGVGDLTYETDAPLTLSADGCAIDGQLSVAFPDGTHGRIHFTAEGDVQFDYNGDGTFDNTVSFCQSQSLPPPNPLFVRVTGSDTNSGYNPETAFRSISKAAQIARSNYKIIVGPGTYREGVTTAAVGIPPQGLTLLADTSGQQTTDTAGPVVIDGTGTGAGAGFKLFSSKGTLIDGFTISNFADAGIVIKSDSDNLRIQNCIIFNNPGDGIRVQDSGSLLVFNNLVYNNGGVGIGIVGNRTGSPDVQVYSNTIVGNGNRGITIGSSNAASPNAVVHNNIVQNNGTGANPPLENIKVFTSPRSDLGYDGDFNLLFPASYLPASIRGAHDVAADAQFVNSGADDFHLLPGSPAIDRGGALAGLPSSQEQNLRQRTTTGTNLDTRQLDMGFHFLKRRDQAVRMAE